MTEVIAAAEGGMPVLGICNGFQILCESHLLPGALIRNDHRHFICRDQTLKVENVDTSWTSDLSVGQEIVIPLKNGEGGFVADADTVYCMSSYGDSEVLAWSQVTIGGIIGELVASCHLGDLGLAVQQVRGEHALLRVVAQPGKAHVGCCAVGTS